MDYPDTPNSTGSTIILDNFTPPLLQLPTRPSTEEPGSIGHAKHIIRDILQLPLARAEKCPLLDPHGSTVSYLVELHSPIPHAGLAPVQFGTVRTPIDTHRLIVQFKGSNRQNPMSDAFWARNKVAAMKLAREILHNTPFDIAVPDVYAWSDGAGQPGDKAWVVQSATRKWEPLAQHFRRNEQDQEFVLDQIAELQGYFQEYKMPRPAQGYGSFGFDSAGQVCVAPMENPNIGGPFTSIRDMMRAEYMFELSRCEQHGTIRGWSDKPELKRKLDEFTTTGLEKLLNKIPDVKPQFTLNKIELSNFMCDLFLESRIIYIVDFSYATISHPLTEFFNSYHSMFGNLPLPLDPDWGLLYRSVLEGFEKESVDVDLRELDNPACARRVKDPEFSYAMGRDLYAAFKRAGIATPRKMRVARIMATFRGLCAAVGGRDLFQWAPDMFAKQEIEEGTEVLGKYLSFMERLVD
ncbi:uncharacterized protein BO80DRAFT_409837 [Aspergillus ibericus CBS 121593]|uniref:Aminoglycoside phosphotransferase domain-containing protein n=1 Tax=Aspergillus ibericus CBS 121593 TaxID=1448316 RepID=A0A395GVM3_9EURO|nr:hypothetical protein BO80DRAFT_409837 [Aspergillus ibericus CBS 121593]RAK99621.1 hypothetical protein BO80DRAFT_409837 [Aspergillus ibericus CBS 121593]